KKDVAHIVEILNRYAPCRLLLGMPMNMNGTVGEQGEKVQRFAEAIQKQWDGELQFFDERLTTMAARRVLVDADISRGKQKKVIDKLAAVLILQGYMDSHPNG
ncbi:MAG: Holliday junction resolvase RuvX, partial [Clostridia bacterium]|nr:Holliday junction resolvase RuvX [Clostridia bacterium]